jgi:hypothetical protein
VALVEYRDEDEDLDEEDERPKMNRKKNLILLETAAAHAEATGFIRRRKFSTGFRVNRLLRSGREVDDAVDDDEEDEDDDDEAKWEAEAADAAPK